MNKIVVAATPMAVDPTSRQHNWLLAKFLIQQTAGPGAQTILQPLPVRTAVCHSAFARC